jgi:hypothetical protein
MIKSSMEKIKNGNTIKITHEENENEEEGSKLSMRKRKAIIKITI